MITLRYKSVYITNEENDRVVHSIPYQASNEFIFYPAEQHYFSFLSKANDLSNVNTKIWSFRRLRENWDYYYAKPINDSCIFAAIDFVDHLSEWIYDYQINIETPFVAPRPDGGLQFEWENDVRYLEIGLSPGLHSYDYLFINDATGFEIEDATNNADTLIELLKWLS